MEQVLRNREKLETIALKYLVFPNRLRLEEVTERMWLPVDLQVESRHSGGSSLLPRAWNVHSAHHPPGEHVQGCSLERERESKVLLRPSALRT